MPLTANITVGIADVLQNDVLIGTRKAINFVDGGITWTVTDDTDRVNVEGTAAGGASSPIPTTTVNATDLDEVIATTVLEGKRIKYMYADLVGVVSGDGATAIHIGIEGDQEDLIIIEADGDGLFADGITNPYVTSLKTTAANRNISVKAIGGTFSAGTIEIYGEVTL